MAFLPHFSQKKEIFYFDITTYRDHPTAVTCNVTMHEYIMKAQEISIQDRAFSCYGVRCSDIMNVLENRHYVKWMWGEKNEVLLTSIYPPVISLKLLLLWSFHMISSSFFRHSQRDTKTRRSLHRQRCRCSYRIVLGKRDARVPTQQLLLKSEEGQSMKRNLLSIDAFQVARMAKSGGVAACPGG